MKNPTQIIEEMRAAAGGKQERTSTVSLMKAIITDAKEFFTGLFKYNTDILTKNKFDVEVKNPTVLPEIFKIDGEVSVKDTKALLIGLNEIVRGVEKAQKSAETTAKGLENNLKPEKIDFSSLEKAVNNISIPEPLKEVSVDNQIDYNKKLDEIKKEISKLKLDPQIKVETKASDVVIDLSSVKSSLETIIESLKPTEEMIGLSWNKDEQGNVTEIIEKYPSGNIVSSGWNLGRVKISDERKSS